MGAMANGHRDLGNPDNCCGGFLPQREPREGYRSLLCGDAGLLRQVPMELHRECLQDVPGRFKANRIRRGTGQAGAAYPDSIRAGIRVSVTPTPREG
jgi:hypothetical protein